jgi:hypothetical protein
MTQGSGTNAGTQGAQQGAQQNDSQQGQQQGNGGTPEQLTWDTWLAQQPEEQRTIITGLQTTREQGLRTALNSEREANKQHEAKIRELAGKAEKGSESEKQLTAAADQLAEANRRADFFQEAAKPEVGLTDPHLAWLAINASAEEYVDRKGNVNFVLLKERHPGLFKQAVTPPKGNAGNGAGGQGAGTKTNMNSIIRRAAGRE